MAAAQLLDDELYREPDLDFEDEPLPEKSIWTPEEEPHESSIIIEQRRAAVKDLPRVKPSQFTKYAFRMPTDVGEGRIELRNFSFDERPHMLRPYDTPARRLLLMCGRQVEKSTLIGNIGLCYSCMVPGHRTLFVSPSGRQTDTFSKDRVKEPLETSDVLKKFTTKMLSQNILEKQFVNRSKYTLRYAFLNADRCRGIPAWQLQIDEIQDILSDNIPVIEQCLSHAPEMWKRYIYSGTPKSLDNTIEDYWSKRSTMNEWVVPCEACNNWNILGEENIGKKGLICDKCGKRIYITNPKCQWAAQRQMDPPTIEFEGFRIPQLMVPWRSWNEILYDYEHYSRARFYNEVLGRSFDSGLRPITRIELERCCNPKVSMQRQGLEFYRNLSFQQSIYAGIDWGTGENSYTVISLCTYIDGKFRMFYQHRFSGREVEPDVQMGLINELLDYFNVRLIGVDYGGGFYPNDKLTRRYGKQRVWKYQYLGQLKTKVEWDPKLGRFKVRRNEVMAHIFNAIKAGRFCEFPNWAEWGDPCGQDFLNIYSEYNEVVRFLQFRHSPDRPDDSFHSFLYAWLVSMLEVARPDIITPDKENADGTPVSGYIRPVGL